MTLGRCEDPSTEHGESRPAVHAALDEFEAMDVSPDVTPVLMSQFATSQGPGKTLRLGEAYA